MKWLSQEQIDLLMACYETTPAKDLAAEFGVSVGSIHNKASQLGLTSGYGPNQARKWQPTEDDLIRQRYGMIPTREIARQLDRSEAAVRMRASQIGVIVLRRWSPEEDAIVRREYPSGGANGVQELLGTGRSVTAIKHRARNLRVSREQRDA